MVKLCQQEERREIGTVRLEQSFETLTRLLVLIGFNELADGLEMNVLVNVTTFEAKCSVLSGRVEQPGEIWNECDDEANSSGQEEDAGKSSVGNGRTEFEPCSPRATEQNRKQKHL